MKKSLLFFYLLISILFISCGHKINENDFETFYEKSNFLETPRYEQTIEYCKKLVENSSCLHYTSIGKSPQGREIPLLIADANGNFTPEAVKKTGNAILLIQACIHAGESEGKDAGLMFLRDIALFNKLPKLLNTTILFIPIFNVDGHERFGAFNRINQNGPKEMGWRTTAQNLNLNRDYIKADAPEMQAWLKMFSVWLPDFVIDCHTTDGADYQYTSTYGMELDANIDSNIGAWSKDVYLKTLEQNMNEIKMPIIQYVMFRKWHDPRSGLIGHAAPPRFSTGYCAVNNRPCLLIETHMLKDYKTRVNVTYEMIKQSLIILQQQHTEFKQIIAKADEFCTSKDFSSGYFPLNFYPTNDSVMITFKGKTYNIVKSDLTGGDWFQYSQKDTDFIIPYFNHQRVADAVKIPAAYIVPVEWSALILPRLMAHGIKYSILDQDKKFKITSYHFTDVKLSDETYEGHQSLTSFNQKEFTEERQFIKGAIIVPIHQRTARIILHIFEPKSQDSFLHWGYFNSIFEQKEYAETYVMEKLGREMLKKDTVLKREFENLRKTNKAFDADQWLMLNWLYSHSEYADLMKDVYPVGRIETEEQL